MSTRDLIGRPLVPYFDEDENVNASLSMDTTTSVREEIDVDARVWNKELGYFEYPKEQAVVNAACRNTTSAPIAIKSRAKQNSFGSSSGSGSYGSSKMLLTPAMMLSNSLPDATSLANDRLAADANGRSASATRGSKQSKSRSNTPSRRRNNKQGTDGNAANGIDNNKNTIVASATSITVSSSKKNKNKGSSTSNGQHKQKEELSSSGKWAWSAFQSSPDPKQLPLPPFLVNGGSALSADASPVLAVASQLPSLPPVDIDGGLSIGTLDFSLEDVPERPPMVPPENSDTQQPLLSIEHSMTQDLRRLLNIGGG